MAAPLDAGQKFPEGVGTQPNDAQLGRGRLAGVRRGGVGSCSLVLTGIELCWRTWPWAPIQPVREAWGRPNVPSGLSPSLLGVPSGRVLVCGWLSQGDSEHMD